MLNQKLQQRLVQKLSPQQVLVMRLLQEPVLSLEQRIKQELEENPALEEASRDEVDQENLMDEQTLESMDSEEDEFREDIESLEVQENEFSFEDYMDEDEIPGYKLMADNKSPDEKYREIPMASGISFQDYLISQIGLHQFTDKQFIIASTLIGNIDEAGYLRREISALVDDLAFNQNIEATQKEITEVLKIVQTFDPPGIAARNLQECLLIQLRSKSNHTYATRLAEVILKYYFDAFSKKHYQKILQKGNISEEELKEAMEEIQNLNPKPGAAISETSRINQDIIPDFTISNSDNNLELTLNSRNTPELILNHDYIEIMKEFSHKKKNINNSDKAALSFIKQKIDSARGFIDAIKQRQETLYITMKAIMDYQREYFLSGDDTKLRPMILKDISTLVGLDISTISRVANSKYVQTPFGTFLLKSFFSESMHNINGEEISTREIKKILADIILTEDKTNPLKDDELMELLKTKGYSIARRTVAKYRKQLHVPVARLRKEF